VQAQAQAPVLALGAGAARWAAVSVGPEG